MLDRHNSLRSQVALGQKSSQPAGANIVLMEWDDRAAQKDDTWISQCVFEHNTDDDRKFGSYSYVGQNLQAWSNAGEDPAKAADSWFSEHSQFTFDGNSCTDVCGHYTQVIWASTAAIGCAKAECPKWQTTVGCDYAAGGNIIGEQPYTLGDACSACPSNYSKCHKGLCATEDQCIKGSLDCTDSTVTDKTVEREDGENADDIISRVVD